MANPAALITSYMSAYDAIGATDVENADRRARLLVFLNHINSYVHMFREWEWTFAEIDFTILSGGNSVALDTAFVSTDAIPIPNFLEFGRNGSIYDTSRRLRLREKTRYVFQRVRRELGASGFNYPFFTIFGGKIQIPYTVTADTTFTGFYRIRPETLTDGSTAMLIPDRYANTVLLPGLAYRAQESKQDARETWGTQFREGLSQMVMIENPRKTSTSRMPLAIKGAW